MRHPRQRRRRWSAMALAFFVALLVVFFKSPSAANAAAAASSSSSTPSAAAASPGGNASSPSSTSTTSTCEPTSFNGTVLGDGSCLVQRRRAWFSAAAALAVVSAPTETDCCEACHSRESPNGRIAPQKACVFVHCDARPGVSYNQGCDDGLGGRMKDGECRILIIPLPLAASLKRIAAAQPPPDAASPPASAGIVSGVPASTFTLALKNAAPPKGYRAGGPVRFSAGLFSGGPIEDNGAGPCDFSTDELFRQSVSRPECVSNASTVAEAARFCSKLKGCTGLSWYPVNGISIVRALSAKPVSEGGGGGFADINNTAFGALPPEQPWTRDNSLAVFYYGALDERCVAPSGYSFLFVKENAPRPPGLESSLFGGQEAATLDAAARKRRVAGLVAAGVATGAVCAAVAALSFFLLRCGAAAKRRRRGQAASGGEGGSIEGGLGGGFRDEKSVGGGSEAFSGGDPSFRGSGAGASPFATTTPRGGTTATQSSLERMVRDAASRRARIRALAEGASFEYKKQKSSSGGGGGGEDEGSSSEDQLEDWELPLSEIKIIQRENGSDWLLGKGASGNVYRGMLSGLQHVAVKVFLDQECEEYCYFDDDNGDDSNESEKEKAHRRAAALEAAEKAAKKRHDALRREVVILKSLRDPNVVRFVGANVCRGSTVLVTEFCPRGDLYRALNRDGRGGSGSGGGGGSSGGRRFTWVPSYVSGEATKRRRPGTGLNWSVAADVSRGLAYIHARGLIHLDIKSPNIFLNEQFKSLIGDLGLARVLRDGGGETGTGSRSASSVLRPGGTATAASSAAGAGTFAWAAPELLLARRVSEAADIYSLGVVLWELSTGEPPPPSRRLRPLEVPEEAPAGVRDLIDRCLEEEPGNRPAARELLEFFEAGLAQLDAAAGVALQKTSVGVSVWETLKRASSRASSLAAGADDDKYALTPGGAARGGAEAAALRKTSVAPRQAPLPEGKEGDEEEVSGTIEKESE